MIPKKTSNQPWIPEHHPHNCNDKNSICAFLDEEICIEAKVKMNPDVSIGKVKIECLESEIEPCSEQNHSSEECTVHVIQLVRIKIPVHFKAKVKVEESGVYCPDESSDFS